MGTASHSTGADTTDADTTAAPACEAPAPISCDRDDDPFHAIGLDCPGDPGTPLIESALVSDDLAAWRVAVQLGNAFWAPREGEKLLMLSTGTLPLPDPAGQISVPPGQTDAADGNNANPDGAPLPPPISTEPGSNGGAGGSPFSNCDGQGDCSDTLPDHIAAGGAARDQISVAFDVEVPVGTHGWRVELAWLSAEFPARVDALANDAFVAWVSSEAYVGNIATYDGELMSVTGLRPLLAEIDFVGRSPALLDTGFGGDTGRPCSFPWAAYPACPRGGASDWLTLAGPAAPGEQLSLTLALFDHGDTELDTVVLIDGWRWDCDGCVPGKDCGVSTAK